QTPSTFFEWRMKGKNAVCLQSGPSLVGYSGLLLPMLQALRAQSRNGRTVSLPSQKKVIYVGDVVQLQFSIASHGLRERLHASHGSRVSIERSHSGGHHLFAQTKIFVIA